MTATLTYPGVGFGGKVFMQDFTSTDCKAIPDSEIGTQGTLIDLRDNNVYWVARLKDGSCWMTQNLAFADPNSTLITDVKNWTSTEPDYRAYYKSGNINTEYPGFTPRNLRLAQDSGWIYTNDPDFYGATSYISADGKMACTKTANSWKGDITSDYLPCRMYTTPPENEAYSHNTNQHNGYGFYYSWESVTNGTGSALGSDSTYPANATSSICPNTNYNTSKADDQTSWILPTSNSTTDKGSFGLLLNGLSVSTVKAAPYYFRPAGLVAGGNLNWAGSYAYYWSSTANSDTNAYYLASNDASVNPSSINSRYFGFSVRCLVLGS